MDLEWREREGVPMDNKVPMFALTDSLTVVELEHGRETDILAIIRYARFGDFIFVIGMGFETGWGPNTPLGQACQAPMQAALSLGLNILSDNIVIVGCLPSPSNRRLQFVIPEFQQDGARIIITGFRNRHFDIPTKRISDIASELVELLDSVPLDLFRSLVNH